MREYHNFKGVPKLPGGMRNVKHPHILQECILSHPRGAVAGYLSIIKNKEAITFFLLNENAPNFVRAEGMARK